MRPDNFSNLMAGRNASRNVQIHVYLEITAFRYNAKLIAFHSVSWVYLISLLTKNNYRVFIMPVFLPLLHFTGACQTDVRVSRISKQKRVSRRYRPCGFLRF